MTTSPLHHTRALLVGVVTVAAVLLPRPDIVNAQEASGRGSKGYFEALGNGLVFSANYEFPLGRQLNVRLGAGGLWFGGVRYVLGLGMVGWELLPGSHAIHFSTGVGIIRFEEVFFLDSPGTSGYATASVAYRYQPRRRGVFVQLAFTPVLAESTLLPWGGLAVGFTH